MNTRAELTAALAGVPGIDAGRARFEQLRGGLRNRVYLVSDGERHCVIRCTVGKGGIDPERTCEVEIQRAAAAAGIAPAVLFADEGVLVSEYLRGTAWKDKDLAVGSNVERLGELLRRVHALPRCGTSIDLRAMCAQYEKTLHQNEELRGIAARCTDIVDEDPVDTDVACCHNDIVASNVLDSGDLRLLDWEYACDNDPLFDLASVVAYHDLDDTIRDRLLDAWAGGRDPVLAERLAAKIRVFDAVQWLWLASRQVQSPSTDQARRLEEIQRGRTTLTL